MLILLLMSLASVDSQPTPAATRAKPDANSAEKVICRRFAVTGSLVGTYKACKTQREWDQERDNIRASGPGSESCRNAANGGPC